MKPEKKPAQTKARATNSKKPASAPAEKKAGTRAASKKSPEKSEAAPKKSPGREAKGQSRNPSKKSSGTKAEPQAAPAKKPLKVPAILLEGDASPTPKGSGPGSRYKLAPESPASAPSTGSELPESYGTGRLFLAARDPHWLYASWDMAREEQKKYNALSRDGHLAIKVYRENDPEPIIPDVHVHPESRNWFIHVPDAETRYFGVLGYYDRASDWNELSRSRAAFTPPDAPSTDITAQFATIPSHISFHSLQDAVRDFISENLPLVQAVLKASPEQEGTQDAAQRESRKPWSLARAAELAKLITIDSLRRVWMGSFEITELIRRKLQEDVSSISAAELSRVDQIGAKGQAVTSISSPFGVPEERGRKFWFNVNAELIIYGATEPDAKVTIGGREVKLRPDGSFSFRFSLPDGRYELPAIAISGDGAEAREATLQFSRSSDYKGTVGEHPRDQKLKPPRADNL